MVSVKVKYYQNKTIVTLNNMRLDAAMVVHFKNVLKNIADDGAEHIILDLHQVNFIDSSGLGALMAHLKYTGKERKFELSALNPAVNKVLKLTHMDRVFQIYPNIQDVIDETNGNKQ